MLIVYFSYIMVNCFVICKCKSDRKNKLCSRKHYNQNEIISLTTSEKTVSNLNYNRLEQFLVDTSTKKREVYMGSIINIFI